MREVVFRNLLCKGSRKREICMEEVVHENGHVSRLMKRSLYFIRGTNSINSQDELNTWMKEKESHPEECKRRFHVMKIHSDRAHSDTVICKARGSFYVVVGKEIFNIVYIHCLRMEISKNHIEK